MLCEVVKATESPAKQSSETMRDFQLWNLMQERDEEAFATLYHNYVDALYAYGLHLGYHAEDVEDAIHDLFVSLYHKRGQYPAVQNVKVYLLIALKNTLLNRLPKAKMEILNPELHDQLEDSLEELWIHQEERGLKRELLKEGITHLSPRQKQVLYFRYYKTMSFKQIAEEMQINTQSAKNIAQTAVKKLKTYFSVLWFILCFFY